jgi:uncharacterized Zn-binding protein involved in type VI secretion
MGKPAARLGDSTAHGGVIMGGAPNVLIGGMPAARMGDMHVCPMMNPGVPPPPHVGQQILMGSPTVLIGGMMAARMGDPVMCAGPPDSIMMGCPTVLIGESAVVSAGAMSSAAMAGGGTKGQEVELHFLDVTFVDKAGLPIKGIDYKIKSPSGDETMGTLSGPIKKTGIPQGTYEIQLKAITSAKWSKKSIEVGEKVNLKAETIGIDSGTKASFEIFMKGGPSADKSHEVIGGTVQGDKAEVEWEFQYKDDTDQPVLGKEKMKDYYPSDLYFIFKADNYTSRSGLLSVLNELKISLKNDKGDPVSDEEYRVYLPNGEVRQGKLDKNGQAVEKKVPVKKSRIVFPNVAGAKKLPS